MGAAIGTMFKVHRVVAVQVHAPRNPNSVTGPQRTGRVRRVQPERLRMLAEAINVRVWWKRRLEAQVLRLEDERVVCDCEQYLAGAGARNIERERRLGVRKFDLGCIWVHVRVRRGSREDRIGDFVAITGCVSNLEMNACVCAMVRGRRPSEVASLLFVVPCARLSTYQSRKPRPGREF